MRAENQSGRRAVAQGLSFLIKFRQKRKKLLIIDGKRMQI